MAKILIVEDAKAVNKLISDMLSSEGHEIISCYSVEEALDVFKGNKFELIITDLIMPGKDGVELLEYITAHTAPVDKPALVAISAGSVDTVNAETALKSVDGLADYVLQKPFTKEVLLEVVSNLLSSQWEVS